MKCPGRPEGTGFPGTDVTDTGSCQLAARNQMFL